MNFCGFPFRGLQSVQLTFVWVLDFSSKGKSCSKHFGNGSTSAFWNQISGSDAQPTFRFSVAFQGLEI